MEKALKIDLVVISSLIITVKIISAVTLNLIQFFLLVTNPIIFFKKLKRNYSANTKITATQIGLTQIVADFITMLQCPDLVNSLLVFENISSQFLVIDSS